MGLKGFEGLSAIKPVVEANYQNRLAEMRKQLHAEFLELAKTYEQNPEAYAGVTDVIKRKNESVVPFFTKTEIKDSDLDVIRTILASVKTLIENPQVKVEVSNLAPVVEASEPTPAASAPLILQKSDMVKPESDAIVATPHSAEIASTDSVEKMKADVTALDSEVEALTETWTVPLYEVLKAEELLNDPKVKYVYGNEGTNGRLHVAFDQCAIARELLIQKLQEAEGNEPNAELKTLYRRFVKQVSVLKKKVEWHMKSIKMVLEVAPAHKSVSVSEDVQDVAVPTKPLILDNAISVADQVSTTTEQNAPLPVLILNEQVQEKDSVPESPQPQKLTVESLPTAEQVEIDADVRRMESVITSFEEEIRQFPGQYTWVPEHEVNSVKAMIDQFDRMLADYYEEPTLALLEKLKNTFSIIETLHKEVREGHADIFAMLGEVDTYQKDLPRLERSPSNNPFEQATLRGLIENFRGLYARFVRAEEGEEKIMLLRQLVKMYNNVKQAHHDADAAVIRPPEVLETVTEVATLKKIVDDLFEKPNLPPQTVQLLGFAKTEMLTRLGLLSPTDTEYIQLRDKINEVISAAQQLSGEEVTITPSPKVEEAANENIAPRWSETQKKLTRNRALVAALILATASVVSSPDRLSELSADVQVASAGPLSDIGLDAKWGNGEPSTVLVPVRRAPNEEIRVVRPYTGEEAPQESKAATATNGEVAPEVTAARADSADVIVSPSGSADTNIYVSGSAEEADPKSPEYQESIASAEVATSRSNVVEVLRGTEATYPDRAINPLLAAVDSTGIPEVLASKLRAEEKEAFLSDTNRLKAAGVGSGKRGTTFPGEKINYSDPVQRLEQRFNEYRQYLNVPHTEVAVEGDNLTKLVEKSFARDLTVLSEADRLPVVEEALAAYLATPGALENIKLTNKDTVPAGAVVPLQVMARYLADAVAKKVLTANESGSASEVIVDDSVATETSVEESDTNTDTLEESGSASEVLMDAVTTAENYPGGILEYSKAYNEKLESLGIAPKAPSMIDSWFTQRSPDNRALLAMSVGELTKIMMQTPTEVARELEARKISIESANSMYELIIKARAEGQAPYDIDSTLTGEEVIRARVLAEAPKSSN